MKNVSEGESILKVFLPAKYYTKGEEKEKEHWIQGRGSDTAFDREGDNVDPNLLQEWANKINESEVGIGCFPDHDIVIDNIAAVHRQAQIEKEGDVNYLIIDSILNPAHPKFEYYLTSLKMKAPFYYSICILSPLFRENENGGRTFVSGELISIDFVPVPANQRTWVRMKGGSYLFFENCAGKSREEDIMNEKDEERIGKIEETVKQIGKEIEKLVKTLETKNEAQKKQEENTEKSNIDAILAKFDEMNQKIEKISKESTGRDSGAPLSDITQKEYDDLSDLEKGQVWQKAIKGET